MSELTATENMRILIEELIDRSEWSVGIMWKIRNDQISPSAIATIFNRIAEMVEAKPTTSQQMYNYDANGMIARGKKARKSDPGYTKAEVINFLTRYVLRRLVKNA